MNGRSAGRPGLQSHHSQLTSAYTRRDTGHDTETHQDPYHAVSPIQRREGFESPGVGGWGPDPHCTPQSSIDEGIKHTQ